MEYKEDCSNCVNCGKDVFCMRCIRLAYGPTDQYMPESNTEYEPNLTADKAKDN